MPHCRSAPQPSLAGPQSYPSAEHVFGVHEMVDPPSGATPGGKPHLLNPPAPHVCGAAHVPHCRRPPHPSAAGPQVKPKAAHVLGVHETVRPPSGLTPAGRPHLLKPPAPHVSGAVQLPHCRSPPQLSAPGPQSYPRAEQVVGTHEEPASNREANDPHLLKPPPPHVSGSEHAPQSRMPPHPSPFLPHVYPVD